MATATKKEGKPKKTRETYNQNDYRYLSMRGTKEERKYSAQAFYEGWGKRA